MSVLGIGRFYFQEMFMVLIYFEGLLDHRVMVRPKRIMSMKISKDTIGNQTRSLPLMTWAEKNLAFIIMIMKIILKVHYMVLVETHGAADR
jgi:hypothetical protein